VERFETKHIVDTEPPRRFTGAPIDIDVKNADVQEVCRFLADVGHVNIVVASEVSGSVTLRLHHVPWDQALDVVVRVRGLELERDGDIFLVTPAKKSATAR
jgi:type IV pilus assembly protein PilQ